MITTAMALAGAGIASSLAGTVASADAAGNAGKAGLSAAQQQVQMSREALAAQVKARSEGIAQAQKAAGISPGEIDAISKIFADKESALSANLASINKQQSFLDAMDPQVKAAGSNLYNLLTGKSAEILKPIQTQLNFQRQGMMDQLASQMGPGFMTSSAGIEAMTKFDAQASLALNSAQMNAISTVGQQYGQLSGLQQQGQNAITGQTLSAYQQAQEANRSALAGYETVAGRETQATLGAMQANPLNPFGVPAAQGSVVGTAGGEYAGTGAFGQGLANIGAGAGQLGGQIAGYDMFSKMFAPKTAPTSSPAPTPVGANPNNLNIGGPGYTTGSYTLPARSGQESLTA
jgi:hypothetical protein